MPADTLEQRLREWIATQGFTFELAVAERFESAGFAVSVSEFVKANDEAQPREVDVVARHTSLLTQASTFEFVFAVECKHSQDKPWVVFQSRNSSPLAKAMRFISRFASEVASVALLEMAANDDAEQTGLFSLPDRLGHGVKRAFDDKHDRAYEAVAQVCDAAAALVATRRTKVVPSSAVVFPVIVIHGKLFEARLDNTSKVELREVGLH